MGLCAQLVDICVKVVVECIFVSSGLILVFVWLVSGLLCLVVM